MLMLKACGALLACVDFGSASEAHVKAAGYPDVGGSKEETGGPVASLLPVRGDAVSKEEMHQKLHILGGSVVKRLMSIIRCKNTPQYEYVKAADRLMTYLCEEALALLPHKQADVETACGTYQGLLPEPEEFKEEGDCWAVTIWRSGSCMMENLRKLVPHIKVGCLLIQRDEEDPEKKATTFYSKFPHKQGDPYVLLCDPMLATGGSAIEALRALVKDPKGPKIKEENIVFVNLVSAPEGVKNVFKEFPKITILCAEQDPGLNDAKYIVPGLGDFGDRYYGTTPEAQAKL